MVSREASLEEPRALTTFPTMAENEIPKVPCPPARDPLFQSFEFHVAMCLSVHQLKVNTNDKGNLWITF